MTTKERILIAERINSTPKTIYNWEKTKPELIKLIEFGLQKEKEIENNLELNLEEIFKIVKRLENKIEYIEETYEKK